MRGGGTLGCLCAAACAAGGTGEGSSFGSVTLASSTTVGTSSDTGETGSGTTGSDTTGSSTGDATGTAATSGVDTSGSETGEALPCEELLESFAVDPGWTATSLPSDGNVFGWVSSGNASGMAGEIGGTMQRSGLEIAFADRTITVAAGDCVGASGWIVVPNEGGDYNSLLHFGHFGANGPHIGFTFAEGDNATLRVSMDAGTFSEQTFLMEDIATARTWSYLYDPAAASMTLTMDGLGSVTRPVTPDQVGDVSGIDAFGVFKHPHDNPGDHTGLLELYLDEIAYTR